MNDYRNILLCSEDDIKTYSNISDNTDGKYISPAIFMAQKSDLEETIGTQLVKKLQEMVACSTLEGYYMELLNDYVVDYLIYASIVRLIPIVSVKIGNTGAVRTEDDKVTGLSFGEVFNLRDYYQNQADYLKYRLQRYLLANYQHFPELHTYRSIADLQQNLYSSANVPIWLGGARNKGGLVVDDRGAYLRDKYGFGK